MNCWRNGRIAGAMILMWHYNGRQRYYGGNHHYIYSCICMCAVWKFNIVERDFLLIFIFYHCLYTLPKCYHYHSSHMVSHWNSFFYFKYLGLPYLIGVVSTLFLYIYIYIYMSMLLRHWYILSLVISLQVAWAQNSLSRIYCVHIAWYKRLKSHLVQCSYRPPSIKSLS